MFKIASEHSGGVSAEDNDPSILIVDYLKGEIEEIVVLIDPIPVSREVIHIMVIILIIKPL